MALPAPGPLNRESKATHRKKEGTAAICRPLIALGAERETGDGPRLQVLS